MESSSTTNRSRPTSKAVEFRRLCQRIATNDPSLTVVSLALLGETGGGGGGPSSSPDRWSDADAELFARSMESNTVVDRVEVPVVCSHHHQNHANTPKLAAPSSTATDTSCPTRTLLCPTDSLLSLSVSTRVGRALLGVSEVHLVGTRTIRGNSRAGRASLSSSLSSSPSLRGDSGDDESCCGLLLHVLLNILGTSKRLWHLRLVDISFGPAAAASLWNLLSRTSSLRELDLVRCGIWPGSDASPSSPSAHRLLLAPHPVAVAPAHPSSAEVPPPAEPASHKEALVATLVYRAFARNTSVEQLVVDHDPSSSSKEASFRFLNAVMSGLLQRQTLQQQKQVTAAPSTTTVSGRGMLRVFQLQLPRRGDDEALPASLGQFLATTTARDIRVHGGGASSLHRILAACNRNFASSTSEGGASMAAAAAARALRLKGCIVNPGDLAHLCEHIARGSSLTELAVHEMDVGRDGVRCLARALASPEANLQVLDLFDIHAGTPLNVTDGHVGSVFRDALKSNHTLRVLKLGEVTLGSGAGGGSRLLLETLRHNPTLRELDLFHVHDLDLQLLASSCVSLTRLGLVLCCAGIGPHRLSLFLTALQDNATHLLDLDLSSNRFGNSEAVVISVFVKRSTTLCRLALDNNDITDGGAALMFRSVSGHRTMQELSLSGNRLGSPAVRALLESLPAIQLRRLALWWDNDASESSTAARALIQKLASNSSLVGLNLENNLGRAYRPFIDYYLYRNRLCPWLNEHEVDEAMSPVSSSLWPQALERLSRRDASVAYFVMREKLPTWKTCEQIQISR